MMLGTAALGGIKYGDSDRITTKDDMRQMVELCVENGIYSFDTAPSYGNAEEWLGDWTSGLKVQIFTKNQGDKEEAFRSMDRLRRPVFLWHNWKPDPQDEGLPYRVHELLYPMWIEGVTVYPEYVQYTDKLMQCEWVQAPWSICAQGYLPPQRKVIARSVFLRGKLAGDTCDHPDVNRLAKHFGVTVQVLALRAALENDRIDKVLIGPQTMDELKRCIQIATMPTLGVSRYLPLIDMGACDATDPRKFS